MVIHLNKLTTLQFLGVFFPAFYLVLNSTNLYYFIRRDHRDVNLLESAMDKVKTVMTHLNEEKRRTEGQITIFDIYSEIENCPASVVSSHRR